MGREWLVRASNRWWKRKHLFSCDTRSLCHLILDLLFYLIHWILCFENDFVFIYCILTLSYFPWYFNHFGGQTCEFFILSCQIETSFAERNLWENLCDNTIINWRRRIKHGCGWGKNVSIKNLKLIFVLRYF